MGNPNKARNAQFRAAADRVRRRPVGFTDAINRAAQNAARLGSDRRVSTAADRLENRPSGFTSALNRARAGAERRRQFR